MCLREEAAAGSLTLSSSYTLSSSEYSVLQMTMLSEVEVGARWSPVGGGLRQQLEVAGGVGRREGRRSMAGAGRLDRPS